MAYPNLSTKLNLISKKCKFQCTKRDENASPTSVVSLEWLAMESSNRRNIRKIQFFRERACDFFKYSLAYTTKVSLDGIILVFLGNPDRPNEKPLPLPDGFANADEKDVIVFRNGVQSCPCPSRTYLKTSSILRMFRLRTRDRPG